MMDRLYPKSCIHLCINMHTHIRWRGEARRLNANTQIHSPPLQWQEDRSIISSDDIADSQPDNSRIVERERVVVIVSETVICRGTVIAERRGLRQYLTHKHAHTHTRIHDTVWERHTTLGHTNSCHTHARRCRACVCACVCSCELSAHHAHTADVIFSIDDVIRRALIVPVCSLASM